METCWSYDQQVFYCFSLCVSIILMYVIPKIVHHCWMSSNPFDRKWHPFRQSWIRLNIDYTFYFWTMMNILSLPLSPAAARLLRREDVHYVMKSDVVRYEVLRIFGGIYSDTDIMCLKNFNCFLGDRSFAGKGYKPNIVSNGIIGCKPGDPLIERIGSAVCGILENGLANPRINRFRLECDNVNSQSVLLSEIKKIYPEHYFYPYSHSESNLEAFRGKSYPDSFAEHYWAGKDPNGWNTSI